MSKLPILMNNINNKISIVIPVYNESESISLLLEEILEVMNANHYLFELIVINDGSKDKTYETLESLSSKINQLKIIHLRKNYCQTAAMAAGFDNTSGEIIPYSICFRRD